MRNKILLVALVGVLILAKSFIEAKGSGGGSDPPAGGFIPIGDGNPEGYAQPGEFPFHAEVLVRNHSTQVIRCGGAIISPTRVLTSIKCILSGGNSGAEKRITVRAGSLKAGDGWIFKVKRVIAFEEGVLEDCGGPCSIFGAMQDGTIHGLAILELSKRMQFTLRKNKKKKYINTVSLDGNLPKNYTAVMPSFSMRDSRLRRLGIERAKDCPGKLRPRLFCMDIRQGKTLIPREGSPVVALNSNNKWMLVGIYSRRRKVDEMKTKVMVNIQEDTNKKWIRENIGY